MAMLRELLTPRLIASHLLVLAVVAGCLTAAVWQWDRLEQARAHNALAEQRMEAEPAPVDELRERGMDVDALEHRRAVATGTFRPDEEVLQRNRTHQGNQGLHVLTPLELDDGTALLVVRGWVPAGVDGPPVTEAPPPEGRVEVTGILEPSVDQPSFGARDPEEGRLDRVFHADTERLDRQTEGELLPMVLRLQEPAPAQGELPLPVGAPELDEGQHLSYTVQWSIFALLALITYTAWLVRRQRGTKRGAPGTEASTGGETTPGPRPRAADRA